MRLPIIRETAGVVKCPYCNHNYGKLKDSLKFEGSLIIKQLNNAINNNSNPLHQMLLQSLLDESDEDRALRRLAEIVQELDLGSLINRESGLYISHNSKDKLKREYKRRYGYELYLLDGAIELNQEELVSMYQCH